MPDANQQPKIKPKIRRSPMLYTVAGILIGMIGSGGLLFAFMGVQRTETPSPPAMQQMVVMPPVASATPVAPQSLYAATQPRAQATVIASDVQQAQISQRGDWLGTITYDAGNSRAMLRPLNVLSMDNLSFNGEIPLFDGYAQRITFSPDGQMVVVSSRSVSTFFDTEQRGILAQFPNYHTPVFSPDGGIVALVVDNQSVDFLDAETLLYRSKVNFPQAMDVSAMAMNQRGELVVASANNLFFLNETQGFQQQAIPLMEMSFISNIAFHPDGDWLAVAGDGLAITLNIKTQERRVYPVEADRIFDVAFSPDGQWLALGGGVSGMAQAFVQAFRWQQSDVIPPDPYQSVRFEGHLHIVNDVSFTPTGRLLTASRDGSVRLWNVETGELLSQLQV